MTTATKRTIDGFTVEFTEEYGTTDVMIERDGFCSSLEFVKMHGEIEDYRSGRTMPVRSATVDKIKAWADSLGY